MIIQSPVHFIMPPGWKEAPTTPLFGHFNVILNSQSSTKPWETPIPPSVKACWSRENSGGVLHALIYGILPESKASFDLF